MWGSLSNNSRITVLLDLIGGPKFKAQMDAATASVFRFAASESLAGREAETAARRSWLFNQGLYTTRRLAFYGTLGIIGLGAAVLKLGYNYYATMATASVAFKGILGSQQAVHDELQRIYILAARSPFQFPDLIKATRYIMPFTHSLRLTNTLVASIVNGLSGMGNISATALNRASIAMSHMFTVGRLTGQILYMMGRDFLPMQQALEAHFHATGLQIKQMVTAGLIDAKTAAKAFNDYIMTAPAFKGQAYKQATKTLPGALSTLKDLVGMSAASSSGGIFESIRKSIKGIDDNLIKRVGPAGQGKISFTDFVRAVDQQFTPASHAIINTFVTIEYILKAVTTEFAILFALISAFLWPLNKLASLFGGNEIAAKLLGTAIGLLVTNWLIVKSVEEAVLIRTALLRAEMILLGDSMKLFGVFALMANVPRWKEFAFATRQAGHAGAKLGERVFINNGLFAKMSRVLFTTVVPALQAAAIAAWEFTTALLANPITWIIAGIVLLTAGLVILYLKWKPFRDLVNKTFNEMVHGSPIVSTALRAAFFPIYQAYNTVELLIAAWHEYQKLVSGSTNTTFQATTGHNLPGARHGNHNNDWAYKHIFSHIPGLAGGGSVTGAGSVWVGEHGPELVSLPRGANVTRNQDAIDILGGKTLNIYVYPQDVYISGKKVATVTAEAVTDAEARR